MATKLKHTENRKQLVKGCGTILKSNRLEGGYKLVKRKRPIGESAESVTAPAKRRGRPAKAKVTASAKMTAPAKRRGRPAKAKVTASAKMTAPAKRRGRKTAPAKMKASVKRVATAPAKRRGRRKSARG